ncbi:hypothetical protein D3227_28300 [Mesorhizobium waimense]|uniref:Uncharacterized protein n=1 Tax=Mesorhizobium waimense TaxID=1300307 RepID=A0A3A5KK66_9HYPH|nr:hypothetical protein D3227_28300 [Mesorhizobium waimense]
MAGLSNGSRLAAPIGWIRSKNGNRLLLRASRFHPLGPHKASEVQGAASRSLSAFLISFSVPAPLSNSAMIFAAKGLAFGAVRREMAA